MLIPPSLLMIVYAFLAEQSVGAMFIAGIIPGLLLAFAYGIGILVAARFTPGLVGGPVRQPEKRDLMSLPEMVLKLAPIAALIGVVLGGIYGGWFTPTEAGAVGALGALLLAAARRKLGLKALWTVLVETGHITVAISFLIIAAGVYTRMLAMSGLPQVIVGSFDGAGLGLGGFIAVYVIVILLMGTVLDSTSILLIVCPLTLPVAQAFGVDLVWWGVVTILAVEVGLITPPLGLSVFVIKSTLDESGITLGEIFKGAFPFAVVMVLVLILLILVPPLATALI
jgi:tripartite ATP-independent transporter DctM subunit